MNEQWKCPQCETLCTGNFCPICGFNHANLVDKMKKTAQNQGASQAASTQQNQQTQSNGAQQADMQQQNQNMQQGGRQQSGLQQNAYRTSSHMPQGTPGQPAPPMSPKGQPV